MKIWIPMLILALSVTALCVWDTINSNAVFSTMESKSNYVYNTVLSTNISNADLQNEVKNLNQYWTKKMDTLCISISRKDMQPVSDYLQYLYTSIINQNQEDAITYSRLLKYNIEGLKENIKFNFVNLL